MLVKIGRYTLTTSSKDRDGDIVLSSGGKTDAYLKQNILLKNHQRGNPIGVVTDIEKFDDRIDGDVWVDTGDKDGIGKEIVRQHGLGMWNTVSIRFIPTKYERISEKEYGYLIKEWELLEVSLADIPANSEATMQKSLGNLSQGIYKSYQNNLKMSLIGIFNKYLKTSLTDDATPEKVEESFQKFLSEGEQTAKIKHALGLQKTQISDLLDNKFKTLETEISALKTENEALKSQFTDLVEKGLGGNNPDGDGEQFSKNTKPDVIDPELAKYVDGNVFDIDKFLAENN